MAKQNAMNKEGQMTKMNWNRAAKLYGRRTLDHRFENEILDRAERWLAKAENRQRERRITTVASSSCVARRAGR